MIYTKCGSKDKSNFLQSATVEQIQEHTDQIRQEAIPAAIRTQGTHQEHMGHEFTSCYFFLH